MHRYLGSNVLKFIVVGALAFAGSARAQGVTGSALTGTVKDPDGAPIPGAAVQLRNTATGDTYSAVTPASGQYTLDNVQPGGPYTLTIAAEGYEQKSRSGVQLALGQRLTLDVPLRYFGEEVVIESHSDPLGDHSRTGTSTTINEKTITELPLQGRNFADLIATSPAVTGTGGAISFAGQNNRYNNIQIDGGANNDLFGLPENNGTPGGQAKAKLLSIEAIQEFQVQIAPFDVRLGNFAGGLVNAVTKSGTNEFHGSLFGYYQGKTFAGFQDDRLFTSFNTEQFGGTIAGPIVKDKVHFFIATDLQQKQQAFGGKFQISGTDSAADRQLSGFDQPAVDRFNTILGSYGLPTSDAQPPSLSNPDRNLFIKITSSAIDNNHLELSYNLVNANLDVLSRSPFGVSAPRNLRGGYELSNSGYNAANTTNTGRVKLTTNFGDGKLSNEFLGSVSIIRDHRKASLDAPLILVNAAPAGSSPAYLSAGAERFSHVNSVDQNIFQLQDSLSYALGKHRLTAGTSNEFLALKNIFVQAAKGVYLFDSLDAFAAGTPSAFQRNISASSLQDIGNSTFNVSQFGLYLQDEWAPRENLTLQPGIRLDVPFLSHANANPSLQSNAALPIDTGKVPSGNVLWSPRFGFNWDVDGTADTIVRGGAGVFTGRPPYVWVSNAYANNGLATRQITCNAKTGLPKFNPNSNAQPDNCGGASPTTLPPEIDYFDANTKYPQNGRLAVGFDRRLPFGIVGTADFMYTRDINGWYTTDSNLQPSSTTDGDGRSLYGSLSTTPGPRGGLTAIPNQIDPKNVGNAVEVFNKNGGHTYAMTLQMIKQFAQQYSINVGYTFSRSYDRISLTSAQALSNYQFAPLDGDLEGRAIRPSAFDRPHKITITGTASLPLGFGAGLTYIGISGTPYTFNVRGDINGDGIDGNDLPFIPAASSQILLKDPTQYAALDSFINSVECLRNSRGQILQRSACRNPWQNEVDARFTWTSPSLKAGRIEAQLDIFNVMNLISSSWGLFQSVTGFETTGSGLSAVGYDKASNRPIYAFKDPTPLATTIYSPTLSRWRMQFGAKYIF